MSSSSFSGEIRMEEIPDLFINAADLAKNCKLDNGEKKFSLVEVASGLLQGLPIEVYYACLELLDMKSLTNLRRVSQYTRRAIDSLRPYQELYQHAPQAIRACLSTGIAKHIPLLQLHESLTTMRCYYCKDADHSQFQFRNQFGSYLSMFECRRACLFCLRNNPALRAIDLSTAAIFCYLPKSTIKYEEIWTFPLLRPLPGIYGPQATPVARRGHLIRSNLMLCHVGNDHTKFRKMEMLYGNTRDGTHHNPLVKPENESDTALSLTWVAPDTKEMILQTYQTAIQFPYLMSDKKTIEHGVLCEECHWSMRFLEYQWTKQQRLRRNNNQAWTADGMIHSAINKHRHLGCMQYFTSEEVAKDEKREGGRRIGLGFQSIQQHQLFHSDEPPLSSEEQLFRITSKTSA